MIFSDSTDIELKGVSVFYDFNRKMGKSKNIDKDNQKPILDKAKETVTEDINNKESIETKSLKDEIREFKSMLDEGLIDEDEFKKLKNRTIEKYN
ncbi:MAG: SHOCT domain-containing protein [bacterium]